MFIIIPVQIAFIVNWDKRQRGIFVISMLFIDSLVSLNTAYYEKGHIIRDRVKILVKYW
jgi:hypothetical protein